MDQFKRMQKLAGLITESQLNESSKESWLKWIENLNIEKYKSSYDFKEAIKQKALTLNTPEILSWIENLRIEKYKSPYDFKEALKQKILSLNESQMYEIGNKISYEEAEDILSDLRSNDSFQHDIFGKIEDEIRDNMGEDFDEDDVYNQAIDYMIERLVNNPNIWDEYL